MDRAVVHANRDPEKEGDQMAQLDKKRLSFVLPPPPHSFRAFVEKAVRDERTLLCLIESPVATLRKAGVPVDEGSLTKGDCERLLAVVGRLRGLVRSGKLAEDFRFEDVFRIADEVSVESSHRESSSGCNTQFDPKTECTSSKETSQGVEKNWSSSWIHTLIDERGIWAPMFSPGDLAEVVTRMSLSVRALSET